MITGKLDFAWLRDISWNIICTYMAH